MTTPPPQQGPPFQPAQQGPPFQPAQQGQPFQPAQQGQPFQPPRPGQPYGQQGQPYGQPAQPPAQLTQPAGPPPTATAGRSPLWPVALAIMALALLGASYWLGSYVALYGRGINFYLLIVLVAALVAGALAVWSDTAFQIRSWGSDLFGRTVLGWRRVDLAMLTSAAIVSGRGSNSIILGDPQGQIAFSDKKLGPVVDSVRRGLSEAAQQGRLLVPTDLAQALGLPVQQGASKRGKSGMTPKSLAVVGLLLVGLVAGIVAVGGFVAF